MNRQLVVDLITAVNAKRTRAIDNAVDLLDDPDEVRAVLFALVASDIASLIQALAEQEALHPLFSRMSRPLQVMTVMGMLSTIVYEEGKPPNATAQNLSDVAAAVAEIRVPSMIVQQ
jgi:hypothetical protein